MYQREEVRFIDEDAENGADSTFSDPWWRFRGLPVSSEPQQRLQRLPHPPKPHDEIGYFIKIPTGSASNGPSTPQQLKTDLAKTTTDSGQATPTNLRKGDGELLIRAEGTLFMVEGAAALYVHLSGDSIAL